MKIYLFIILFTGWYTLGYAQDSAALYYIPLQATTHANVDFYSINRNADPYPISDRVLIGQLKGIIEDSLKGKYVGRVHKKHTYELRIVMNIYHGSKLVTRYGIAYIGEKMILNNKIYSIENVRSLERFIKQNFKPVTDRQKGLFLFPRDL
ncbi:hypothetical protein FAM09_11975 [Niastella caeni]|uniref:Uncharacterized protein n=1 Tax=Niastella caeni TaxID=2569763 RepID=A0A4S8HUZ4_9BACT|nr:hypothetical protein [Niastella caeni]THU39225.1 hypothetical protein FAM09_11975 [Niastella caeni]